jgi:GntR family transcriptional regulator of gluconate operon
MESNPIEMLTISQQVVRLIRRRIFSGILQPGERVIESKIAEEMDISRGPVREAIKELENDGLIVTHPRKGSYIIKLADKDIEEILTLRALLEGHAVTLAIDNLKEQDFSRLRGILNDISEHAIKQDVLGVARVNMQFHEEICRLSGHQRLYFAWKTLLGPIRMLSAMTTEFYTKVEEIRAHHENLLDSLIKGDKIYAKGCFEKHILNSMHQLFQYLRHAKKGRI